MENMAGLSARHERGHPGPPRSGPGQPDRRPGHPFDAGDGPGALTMADALVPYWMRRGRLAEARMWLDAGAGRGQTAPSAEWVRLVAALASVQLELGDAAGARERAAEAVAGGEALGLARQTLLARCLLGRAHQALGELDEAERLARRSLVDADRLGDAHGAAIALRDLGALARRRGDAEGAREAFEAGLARFREASEGGADLGRLYDREQSALIAELGVLAGQRGERARAEDLLGAEPGPGRGPGQRDRRGRVPPRPGVGRPPGWGPRAGGRAHRRRRLGPPVGGCRPALHPRRRARPAGPGRRPQPTGR